MERLRHKGSIMVLLTLMAHSQHGEVKTQGMYHGSINTHWHIHNMERLRQGMCRGFINTHGTFTTWRS